MSRSPDGALHGHGRRALAVLAAALLWVAQPAGTARAMSVPAGFEATRVIETATPTALAFDPAGGLLVATKAGKLLALARGDREPRTILDLTARVCQEGERGLVGLAVDPAFAARPFLYLYYTRSTGDCRVKAVNRLARFTVRADGTVDAGSERVLLDRIPSPSRYHIGGDVQFGKDGFLYVSVGDGLCHHAVHRTQFGPGGCTGHSGVRNSAAREPDVLVGKILRVDRHGRAPDANGGGVRCALAGRTHTGGRCREIFASGLRNPFRMAFDDDAPGTRFFINDVGEEDWEEINVGRRGAHYGWNLREGRCLAGGAQGCGPPPRGLTDPLFTYHQSTGRPEGPGHRGCEAITGGAFVPEGSWPAGFARDYLFADYVCGKIIRLERDGGYRRTQTLVSGLGASSAVHLRFGPGPAGTALYFTTLGDGGAVWRLDHVPGNRRPAASANATPAFGALPLTTTFDARASSDPDGDPLEYRWDFGDGTSSRGADPVATHTYALPGVRGATLRVRDAHGAESAPLELLIHPGNAPPVLGVTGPRRYRIGERMVLRATATDPQDGPLDPALVIWQVLLVHQRHTHPYLEAHGATLRVRAPRKLGGHDLLTTHLRVRVAAADAAGLAAEAVRELRPRRRGAGDGGRSAPAPAGARRGVAAALPTGS
jgi:glucose/arabinose dehydrogenase